MKKRILDVTVRLEIDDTIHDSAVNSKLLDAMEAFVIQRLTVTLNSKIIDTTHRTVVLVAVENAEASVPAPKEAEEDVEGKLFINDHNAYVHHARLEFRALADDYALLYKSAYWDEADKSMQTHRNDALARYLQAMQWAKECESNFASCRGHRP